MQLKTQFAGLSAVLFAMACSDAPRTTAPIVQSPATASQIKIHGGERYVAIGTSISMGWASNGVYFGSQSVAWPEQLRFGSLPPISLPLIQSPGCTSPLIAPLGAGLRLSGESAAGSTVCAPNVADVVLPTQDVALAGALASYALFVTPEIADGAAPWFARVLRPGTTQVSAALSQNPTLVSVELGGNDVLGTSSGLAIEGVTYTPLSSFIQAFDGVVGTVGAVVPRILIVGVLTDGRKLPALRRGAEIFADSLEFAALHVDVSSNCKDNDNYINVPIKSLQMAFDGALAFALHHPNPVYSCADVPGTQDLILTPSDLTTLNGVLAQMADHQRQLASNSGYAFVSLDALYGRPDVKPPLYSVISQLTSSTPYGPYISFDGVHPSALGHAALALAAAHSLNKTYSGIAAHIDDTDLEAPLAARLFEPTLASTALDQARRITNARRGEKLPTCLIPGGCLVKAPRGR